MTLMFKKEGRIALILALGTTLIQIAHSQDRVVPGRISLLDGYTYKPYRTLGVLSDAGAIVKNGGLLIEFEAGMSQGHAVDSAKADRYAWMKEQKINGKVVKLAMIRTGMRTGWEPEKPRDPVFGNLLLVTYPLGNQKDHAINFVAEILSEEELTDALLMILTFDPNRP